MHPPPYQFYLELIKSRLLGNGYIPIADLSNRSIIAGVLNERYSGIFDLNKEKLNPDYPSIINLYKKRIKFFYNCFSYKMKDETIALPWSNNTFYSYIFPKPLLMQYARQYNKKIKMFSPYPLNAKIKNEFESNEILEILFNYYLSVANKYSVEISDRHKNYFIYITKRALFNVNQMKESFYRYFNNKNTRTILIPSFGWTEIRALCKTARESGHQIIGSTHGNNVGIYKHGDWFNTDLIMCDKYIVPTLSAIELLDGYQNGFELSKKYKSKIISLKSRPYKKLYYKLKENRTPKNIKKIMFIEYPQSTTILPHPTLSNNFQLWLNIKLSLILKRAGFITIMKRHPDRIEESNGIYDNFFDVNVTEPFERIYQNADAFIFADITTTTFPFALMTNLPIVIFETSIEYFLSKEVEGHIRNRCIVIKSEFDNENFIFDEYGFINRLEEKPNKINNNIVEKYFMN